MNTSLWSIDTIYMHQLPRNWSLCEIHGRESWQEFCWHNVWRTPVLIWFISIDWTTILFMFQHFTCKLRPKFRYFLLWQSVSCHHQTLRQANVCCTGKLLRRAKFAANLEMFMHVLIFCHKWPCWGQWSYSHQQN